MGLVHHTSLISLWSVCFIVLFFTISSTSAAQCRHMQKVQDSMKSLNVNVQLGGHVWIHVFGEKERKSKEKPEVGKSMWRNDGERKQAWDAWVDNKEEKTKANCAKTSDTYRECVAVGKLGGVTEFQKCTEVENNVCTEHGPDLDIAAARFDYAFKKVGSKSQWILNTAYPSEYSDCHQ